MSDNPKPRLLEQLRAVIPLKHYSLRTEDAYVHWVREYIRFHSLRHPSELGDDAVVAFLTHLAEIVHEADLRDGKFPRDEARGIDLALRGFLAAYPDDNEVLAHGLALFEGLYAGASRKE